MDRFSGVPIKDPQDAPIKGYCDCGAEIYDDSVFCPECEEMEGEE